MSEHQRPTCGTCVFMQNLEGTQVGPCRINHPPFAQDAEKKYDAIYVKLRDTGCSQWTTPEMWEKNVEFAQLRVEFETENIKAALAQIRRQNSTLSMPVVIPDMRKQ